jgi:hypothetical protein
MLKEGLVQGTHGWDVSLMARYFTPDHPAYMVHTDGYPEREVIIGVLSAYTGSDNMFPTDYTLARHILERDFPHLTEPLQKTESSAQEKVDLRARLSKSMGNVEGFFKKGR